MKFHVFLTLSLVSFSHPALSDDPTTTTDATATATSEKIEIADSYRLRSEILGQTRRINVYFPPSYKTGNSRYPALYLLDGGIQEDFLHIVGIASLAAEFRNLREFIVVGIEGIDRYHDLTPPSRVESDVERLPTSGGSAEFRSFLEKELKPFVEENFRLTEETVLLGESAAGLFVLETFLRKPELFSGYISVSPMLWWDDQSLAKQSPSLLKNPSTTKPRLFLTIANEGGAMRGGVDLVVQALREHRAKDANWEFSPMEHETHGTILHPAALAAIRKFFAIR